MTAYITKYAKLLMLSILISLPALFYGSVELWTTTLLLYISLALFIVTILFRNSSKLPPTLKILFVISAIPVFIATAQVIPLPMSLLSSLSPQAGSFYRDAGVKDYAPLTLSVSGTLTFLMQYATVFLVFWSVVFSVKNRRSTILILATTAVATSAYTFYGILKAFTGTSGMRNVNSTFVGYTHFASFAGLGFFATCALLFCLLPKETNWRLFLRSDRKLHIKLLVGFLIVLLALGVLFSLSRGAIAAAAVATLFFILIHGGSETKWQRSMVLLLIVVGFISLALCFDIEPLVLRYRETLRLRRPIIWASALPLIPRYALTGCGFYSFRYAFSPFKRDTNLTGIYEEAHNDYLNFLIEGGFAALVVLLSSFIIYLMSIRPLLSSERRHKVYAGLCAISVSVFVALQSVVDFQLHIPAVAVLFAILTGSALGLTLANRREVEPKQKTSLRKRALLIPLLLTPSLLVFYLSVPFLTAETLLDKATSLYREGERRKERRLLEKAEHLFSELTVRVPFMEEAHFRAARTSVLLGNDTEAEVRFIEAVRLRPADARYHYHYALLLGRTGREREAIESLKKALKLDPTYIELHLEVGRRFLHLAKEKKDEELRQEALRVLRRAVRVSSGCLNKALSIIYEHFPERKYLREVVTDKNHLGYLRYLLRKKRFRALTYEAEFFNNRRERKEAELYLLRGIGYLNTGREEKALVDFRNYIDTAPNRYEAIRRLRETFAEFGKWWEAFDFWSTLKEDVYPHYVRLNEAEALMMLGKYRHAWERLKLLSSSEGTEVYELMYKCALNMGRRKLAVEYLKLLAKLKPDRSDYPLLIAHHLQEEGRLREALSVIEDVLRRDPDNESAKNLRSSLKLLLLQKEK